MLFGIGLGPMTGFFILKIVLTILFKMIIYLYTGSYIYLSIY